MPNKKSTVRDNTEYKTIDAYVIDAGRQRRSAEQSYGPLASPHNAFYYVTNGQGTFVCGSKRYRLGVGDLFYLPRGVEVTFWADREDPYEYYWVSFGGTYANEILHTLGISPEEPVRHIDDSRLATDFSRIFAIYGEDHPYNNVAALSRLYHIFERLMTLLLPADYREFDVNYPVIDSLIEYIDKNFCTELKIGEVCKKFNINRSYFSKLFKQRKGIPPQEYILKLRLGTAADLLENNTLSVTDIADTIGMKRAQFVRIFTIKYGCSPSEYRRRCRAAALKH